MVAMAGVDQHGMAAWQADAAQAAHARWIEWSWQWMDDITRRTGRLTKTARLIELRGLSLGGLNRQYISRDGAHAKALEDYYPQLLGAAFFCHPPYWVTAVWRVCRPLFPARFIEKVDLVAPQTNAAEARRIERYVAASELPTRFGGENPAWPPDIGYDKAKFY